MKRILQVVTQMEAGGAQRIALWLNDAFTKSGDNSELWFIYQKRVIPADGIVKVFYSKRPTGFTWLKCIFDIFINISKFKPDAIITHTHYSNILVQPLAFILGINTRIAIQHSPLNTYPLMARLCDAICGTIGIYTNNVVVSSTVNNSASLYNRFYKKHITTITNGLQVNNITNKAISISNTRRQLGVTDDMILLVNVGRISKCKNQIFLLNILINIPNSVLCLIGDGELTQEVKNEAIRLNIDDRVIFLGEVPYDTVIDVVASSDIFLFPSIFESMGLALIEAMILRKPIIASKIEATDEFLGDAGIVLELQIDKWVEAINYLINNPEIRVELGEKAGNKANNYNVETMIEKYRFLINRIN